MKKTARRTVTRPYLVSDSNISLLERGAGTLYPVARMPDLRTRQLYRDGEESLQCEEPETESSVSGGNLQFSMSLLLLVFCFVFGMRSCDANVHATVKCKTEKETTGKSSTSMK
ncbi:hypothetical protein BaRGS_00004013 [Batillaria attramentaria]|uniref:Uncharacterized protein n=1 Tax=Batillaria attramentaria TaxID=370345 RepID=A0ABD0LZP1_9CAEN